MNYFDLCHTPALAGNFVIIDGAQYFGYVSSEKGKEKLILTQIPSFVVGQQFRLTAP